MAPWRSGGGPNTFGPVRRMAPKPIGATENGPRPRRSTTSSIVRLALQRSVEADRSVHPVTERLVLRMPTTAQRHVFAVRNFAAGNVAQTHRARHQVRAVLARSDIDVGDSRHARDRDRHSQGAGS